MNETLLLAWNLWFLNRSESTAFVYKTIPLFINIFFFFLHRRGNREISTFFLGAVQTTRNHLLHDYTRRDEQNMWRSIKHKAKWVIFSSIEFVHVTNDASNCSKRVETLLHFVRLFMKENWTLTSSFREYLWNKDSRILKSTSYLWIIILLYPFSNFAKGHTYSPITRNSSPVDSA